MTKELVGTYKLPRREIKFRGMKDGKWYYGYYYYGTTRELEQIAPGVYEDALDRHYILYQNGKILSTIEVEQNTICQYTGLKDRDGLEIYEGDIVKFYSTILDKYLIEYVYFSQRGGFYLGDIFINDVSEIEVIGNVFENPELLEA